MKASDRLEIIIREVQENGQVKVAELSERMGCSEVTIRNDIRKLDQQGVLKKTYGGAVKKEEGLVVQFVPGEYYLNAEKKQRIAKKAYEYIENKDAIIIDDSTTGCYLVTCIKEHEEKKVTVVTNSLFAAAELSSAKHVNLFMIGGHIITNPPSALDHIAARAVGQFHVNKAFVGINGINLKSGLTSEGIAQMEVKKEMIHVSDETYVLADSSKFGNGNLFTVCSMDEIYKVITDDEISKEQLLLAKKADVDIVIA